jgi:hypothetical protein
MASYLLYILTGAILALMAGRHLRSMLRALPPSQAPDGRLRLNLFHDQDRAALHWAEAMLGASILLFGVWMALTASALLAASLLHSFF